MKEHMKEESCPKRDQESIQAKDFGFMTKLHLFNTETREKVPFYTMKEGQVTMYTCGPTVYNYAHIGNFRTYVFEDLLRKVFQFSGLKVIQAMNLTDVDDKTIKGALENKVSLDAYTAPFKKGFFEDLATLNIAKVEYYPEATHYISAMIKMIETLLEKKIAYVGHDQSVYFSIEAFPSYGRLSHLPQQELKSNASGRIQQDEYDKESASDFVLWKAYEEERDGNIFWESPFGKGRPGWHLECSAMATEILGNTIDVHVGGIDNMFPHHENEIAQSEGCTSCQFVHFWLHAEHLVVDGKKMSKSLGNFYRLKDLLDKGYKGREVRYLLMQTHYKTPLNFTFQGLDAARASLQRLDDFVIRLKEIKEAPKKEKVTPLLKAAAENFKKGLQDDVNISVSLSVLFDLVREIHSLIDKKELGEEEAKEVLDLLKEWDTVLSVLEIEKEQEIPPHILKMVEERTQAKAMKDFKKADLLRERLLEEKYVLEDTPHGPRIKKI